MDVEGISSPNSVAFLWSQTHSLKASSPLVCPHSQPLGQREVGRVEGVPEGLMDSVSPARMRREGFRAIVTSGLSSFPAHSTNNYLSGAHMGATGGPEETQRGSDPVLVELQGTECGLWRVSSL